MVFRRQNHVTFIFIKTMSHDLLVQVAYLKGRINLERVEGKKTTDFPFNILSIVTFAHLHCNKIQHVCNNNNNNINFGLFSLGSHWSVWHTKKIDIPADSVSKPWERGYLSSRDQSVQSESARKFAGRRGCHSPHMLPRLK